MNLPPDFKEVTTMKVVIKREKNRILPQGYIRPGEMGGWKEINMTVPDRASAEHTAIAHELGHAIVRSIKPLTPRIFQSRREKLREEIMAWRIAKQIIRPAMWEEKLAMIALKTYCYHYRLVNTVPKFTGMKKIPGVKFKKIKIIPWEKQVGRK